MSTPKAVVEGMAAQAVVINPDCPWVKVTQGTKVQVLAVDYVDAEHTGGRIGMYVYAQSEDRYQYGVEYKQYLTGGEVDVYATMPNFEMGLLGGGFNPETGIGPFSIKMGDALVAGIGLPLKRHVIYAITFTFEAGNRPANTTPK